MNVLDRAIAAISPEMGARRALARLRLGALMNYAAATRTKRASSWRPSGTDADAASAARDRLSYVTRDMIRNNPIANKALGVIAGAVVGDGIVYKVRPADGNSRMPGQEFLRTLKRHLEGTQIDARGRTNIYGLQRLAVMAMVQDGEVLLRRTQNRIPGGLPLQIEVLEVDYLDKSRDMVLQDGSKIKEGIEYDSRGRRVAYHLYRDHPGATGYFYRGGTESERISASEIIHLYRQDRPGQERGVSWFAPVALQLQDAVDYQEAQILRQKIAACFTAFRTRPMDQTGTEEDPMQVSSLSPGRIQTLEPGEEITFANPPTVSGYSEFMRENMQAIAAGLGITYAALTGDLSQTNFSSGRLGRIEMDQNVSAWQWLVVMPQMLLPIGAWIEDAARLLPRAVPDFRIEWVPPARIVVDPAREMRAAVDMISAGLVSRQEIIRRSGYDPEDVNREIIEDRAFERQNDLKFTTSANPESATPDVIGDRQT